MKHASFKKNAIVMLISIAIVLSFAYLAGSTWTMILYGATYGVAIIVITLTIEDLVNKWITSKKEKLNYQYFLGFASVILAVGAFLWASATVEGQHMAMALRLGLAAFFGGLGGWIYEGPYKTALRGLEFRQSEWWAKTQEKLPKGTREAGKKTLAKRLRYYLAGDDRHNDLDFDRPLALVDSRIMSLAELRADGKEGTAIYDNAERYIEGLLDQINFAVTKKDRKAVEG